MRYGRIAGNTHINNRIYRCFEHIRKEDALRFVKKFRKQPSDSDQIMHTFRELILGAYLASNGFEVRHDYLIRGKTPDWCIISRTGALECVVELTNLHVDMATDIEIEAQLRSNGMASVWLPDSDDRLYRCVWRKAQVYKALVEELQIAYVIAVFTDFKLPVLWEDDLYPSLQNPEQGLFKLYPHTSGVLHFEDTSQGYVFGYLANPHALRSIDLPNGAF
jgi:hypothetical protein